MIVDHGFVADGRTVSQIFPEADLHFQVVAPHAIAQARRAAQGGAANLFTERWALDAGRIKAAPGAIMVDTNGKIPRESFEFILQSVREKLPAAVPAC